MKILLVYINFFATCFGFVITEKRSVFVCLFVFLQRLKKTYSESEKIMHLLSWYWYAWLTANKIACSCAV